MYLDSDGPKTTRRFITDPQYDGFGVPVEGTMEYRLAAIQAVNTDYLYLAVFLVISLGCTFLIKPQKKR